MKIVQIDIFELNVPYEVPLKVAIGILDRTANVIIRILTDDGIVGWGEASPFSPITGDTQESNIAAARGMSTLLLGKDPRNIDLRMSEIEAVFVGEPSMRSAFDIALHDIAARAAGIPLCIYLGGALRRLHTDRTIGLLSTLVETAERAAQLKEAGFRAVKLKTGRQGLEDLAHIKATRMAIGPKVALRIDANQGWDLPNARALLREAVPYNVEYTEQPLPRWDVDGLAQLRLSSPTPICADEAVFNEIDALNLTKCKAADYYNIKLGKAGGIRVGQKINIIAQAAGVKCMIGCFAESRLGLTAAAHLAAANPNITFVDLDASYAIFADPVIGGACFSPGGEITLSDKPGIDATFDDKALNLVATHLS